MEQVNFLTDDKVVIAGDFYAPATIPQTALQAVLLLHMMPATKESYSEFAVKLGEAGFYALAIDLRGHGVSINQEGRILDYNTFSDKEHQDSMKDIKAAVEFLHKKGLNVYALVGASIGANLAFWYQSTNVSIIKSVLLSAGFNYRGIKTQPFTTQLEDSQGVYFIGGSKDRCGEKESAGQIAQALYDLVQIQNKKLEILATASHGTELFDFDPQLNNRIVGWLKSK